MKSTIFKTFERILKTTILILICGCNAILFHSHYPYGKNTDSFFIENAFLPDSLFDFKLDTNNYKSPYNLLLRMRTGTEKYLVTFNNHIGPSDEGFMHCCEQYYVLINLHENKPIFDKSIAVLLDCEYSFYYWKPYNIIMTTDSLYFYGKKYVGEKFVEDSIKMKITINKSITIEDYKKQIEKCYKKS